MSYMVRLEDSRVLEDYDGMETAQSLIKSANLELLTKYQLKEQNKDFLISGDFVRVRSANQVLFGWMRPRF